jgi:hypothetical protein
MSAFREHSFPLADIEHDLGEDTGKGSIEYPIWQDSHQHQHEPQWISISVDIV